MNVLQSGKELKLGQNLTSPNGKYELRFQAHDGNLVIYRMTGVERAIWSAATNKKDAGTVVMQTDGNLVIYKAGERHHTRALWSSRTNQPSDVNYHAELTDQGKLVIYSEGKKEQWSSTRTTFCSHWMAFLDDKLTLRDICMPGAHDAGMYEAFCPVNFGSGIGEGLAKCQSKNLYEQLCHGVRYFDLRPAYWTNLDSWLVKDRTEGIRLHHGDGATRGYGPLLVDVLKDVKKFMDEGWEETVLLEFSHITPGVKESSAEFARLIADNLGAYLPAAGAPPRGTRLATMHHADEIKSPNGRYKLSFQTDGNLVLRRTADDKVLWASGTHGRYHQDNTVKGKDRDKNATELVVQANGNLVIYDKKSHLESADHAVWSTGTQGNPGAGVFLEDDGNLAVRATNHEVLWETGTGAFDLPLGQLRGKVLVMVEDYSNGEVGMQQAGFHAHFRSLGKGRRVLKSGRGLRIFDSYADKQDSSHMIADQMHKFGGFGRDGEDSLFMLNWTLTPVGNWKAITGNTVEDYAKAANPRLLTSEAARESLFWRNTFGRMVNIINTDYVDTVNALEACWEIMDRARQPQQEYVVTDVASTLNVLGPLRKGESYLRYPRDVGTGKNNYGIMHARKLKSQLTATDEVVTGIHSYRTGNAPPAGYELITNHPYNQPYKLAIRREPWGVAKETAYAVDFQITFCDEEHGYTLAEKNLEWGLGKARPGLLIKRVK